MAVSPLFSVSGPPSASAPKRKRTWELPNSSVSDDFTSSRRANCPVQRRRCHQHPHPRSPFYARSSQMKISPENMASLSARRRLRCSYFRRQHLLLICLGVILFSSPSSLSPFNVDALFAASAETGDDTFVEDGTLEDLLVSDYDSTLDISGDDGTEEIMPQKTPDDDAREKNNDDDARENNNDSVIILSSVDGTLAGISRTSGQVLWKQSNAQVVAPNNNNMQNDRHGKTSQSPPLEWNKFLSPLVSTSTTKLLESKRRQNSHQWHAVPSIDGTVYLTSGRNANNNKEDDASHELSTVAHIRDLVDRAPFVDAHQRFFVGSRKAMVAAVDEATGEILRVVPKFKGGDHGSDGDDEDDLPPSLEGRAVVWIGRLEYIVTVHDLHKGTVDVEFSVAEILSVDEMINGDRRASGSIPQQQEGQEDRIMTTDVAHQRQEEETEMERVLTDYIAEALRHPSDGDRILRLPAPPKEEVSEESKSNNDDNGDTRRDQDAHHSSMGQQEGGLSFLVSTPSGNVAFRDFDDSSKSIGWVSFDLLDSPAVYAIEASSGRKIRVTMLPDDSSISPPPEKESLPLLALEQQIAHLEQQALPTMIEETSCEGSGECGAMQPLDFNARGSVVGALENGQIYALPLGERTSKGPPQFPLGLPQPPHHSLASSEMVNVNSNDPHAAKLNTPPLIGFQDHASNPATDVTHLGTQNKLSSCTPSSPLYPGCLIGASITMSSLLDVNGNLDMASVFASNDWDFDLYLDMLEQKTNTRQKSKNFFLKILTSWLAPTVALIFVVSFEVGRRERIKAGKRNSSEESSSPGNDNRINATRETEATDESSKSQGKDSGGVIQLSNEILGYGGHGTIVYRGVVDKRQVAVKRLLNMYHSSADREISLLIESDGHPNVVRYFLKESRGEFVYLALELCDMSLNDLIASLSKLRNVRKEDTQSQQELLAGVGNNGAEEFDNATRSLLLQIASGVRHIHSLRIVHRDLKPQNILLRWHPSSSALRNKQSKASTTQESSGSSSSDPEALDDTIAHTSCSDTNAKLESFKNQEYVPKISDMGLGKQLAGQSSFGLSTLGTGSVSGGVNGTATGDAGAGAGSVGWQAPEVMAMRSNHNNESSAELEGSPLEIGRTSRSVDIFSLGCVFYCTVLPGLHPFGNWYEREAKIMDNSPNKADLDFVSPDAKDLILSMIHRDARLRPSAEEVCEHPYFWSLGRRLKFLCELSDRIESYDTATALTNLHSAQSSPKREGNNDTENNNGCSALNIFAIEKGAVDVFGASWEKKMDPGLIEASLSRRTYDPSSVRDCLRMIRNKHHHFDELPQQLKDQIGSNTDGLSSYISRSLPHLLMHCYHFCITNLAPNDAFALGYRLPISRYSSHKARSKKTVDERNEKLETIPDEHVEQDDSVLPPTPELEGEPEVPTPIIDTPHEQDEHQSSVVNKFEEMPSRRREKLGSTPSLHYDLTGIVLWSGSSTAKDLNCRGWYRSDDDWTERIDSKLRKRNANLVRCVEDPKFRTRLCNHWDVSLGTYCPVRKKKKCIFAHGPVELRVKEGKRKRWGTLVRKDGLCANPIASGGEDTYGAARNIEKTRKEKGQWSVDNPQKHKGKGIHKGTAPSPNK